MGMFNLFSSDNYHKVFPSKPFFVVLWLKTVTAQSTSENEAFSNTHGPIYDEKTRKLWEVLLKSRLNR